MSELPNSWAETTLTTVAVITTGNTPSTKEPEFYGGSIPFAKPSDLDKASAIFSTEQCLTEEGASQARLLRPGAVLVSCIGNLGKVGIAGTSLATNQQINAAEFHPSIVEDRYGYFVCKTLKPWMERESSATTIAILNKGRFSEAPFPLAPLPEQKRIADKLDTVLARVDACRDRLDRLPTLLKRFRQSILAATTSGRLTEDWRANGPGSNEQLAGWKPSSIGEIAVELRYGTSKKCDYQDVGEAVLRIPNMGDRGRLDLRDLKRSTFDPAEIEKLSLKVGDILIIRSNGSVDLVGKSCVVEADAEGYLFAGYLMRLRVNTAKVLPRYVHFCLTSPTQRQQIELISKSTSGVNNINSEEVRSLPVHIPLLVEQHEIVRRVEILFAFADRLEARLATARKQVEQLTPALLAKAFRGELVPQDPADEPASELLKRLATAGKDSLPKARRGKVRAGV